MKKAVKFTAFYIQNTLVWGYNKEILTLNLHPLASTNNIAFNTNKWIQEEKAKVKPNKFVEDILML